LNPRPKIHHLGLYILILATENSLSRDPPGGRPEKLACNVFRPLDYRPFGQAILLIVTLILLAGKKDRMSAA
jgi:hypothetical protein